MDAGFGVDCGWGGGLVVAGFGCGCGCGCGLSCC